MEIFSLELEGMAGRLYVIKSLEPVCFCTNQPRKYKSIPQIAHYKI